MNRILIHTTQQQRYRSIIILFRTNLITSSSSSSSTTSRLSVFNGSSSSLAVVSSRSSSAKRLYSCSYYSQNSCYYCCSLPFEFLSTTTIKKTTKRVVSKATIISRNSSSLSNRSNNNYFNNSITLPQIERLSLSSSSLLSSSLLSLCPDHFHLVANQNSNHFHQFHQTKATININNNDIRFGLFKHYYWLFNLMKLSLPPSSLLLSSLSLLSLSPLIVIENIKSLKTSLITGSIQSLFTLKGTAASASSSSASTSRSLFPKRNCGKVSATTSSIRDTFSKHFYSTTTSTTTKIMAPIDMKHDYDYDLIVIGGGSGGLAASKEAASLGKKVCMLDFVQPTPHGVTWGVGGTCVNVGCIPKKLMHHASLIGGEIEDAHYFGWQTKNGEPLKDNLKHDWSTLVNYVQNNIKGSNFSYRALLATQQVKYLNAYGTFVEPNKLRIVYKNKKEEFITSKNFIVATGERPVYPIDCKGALKYSITSDDLFSLKYPPGRTLVVGASYVALECAGFLRGLGYDVTVMVRSIVLRGFDRQCSEHVRNYMENYEHVKFIDHCVMKQIDELKPSENNEPPLLRATYRNLDTDEEMMDEFNTILFAIGRKPCTDKIGLDIVGVEMDTKGYIPNINEQTNVPHIYAIGDILQGRPQLTPVAIEAGILLARRLFTDQQINCDYINVPTTVFTPLEYGCCGYTEEEAIEKFGLDNIEVYHQYFTPTEWKLNYYDRPRKPMNVCYAKVITTRSNDGDSRKELLLGFHYVGPNAGEIIQFTPFPLKMKATKADLDSMIGIHPTCAEIFTMLPISKRSGKEATQQGCCG
ncbi:thioredoxin reductase 1, cytoplasmic-like [Dermatophagoides pteronyssinus]|uniref:thioredoxin reductase 1, cytoplasmic-like n=1 Tax=Dermatophagoides pteronyssinus TaxID=6956 RepID=UPI003F67681D